MASVIVFSQLRFVWLLSLVNSIGQCEAGWACFWVFTPPRQPKANPVAKSEVDR